MTRGTTAAEMLRKHIGRKADLLPLTMLMEIGEAMIEYGQQCADAEAAAMRERAAEWMEKQVDIEGHWSLSQCIRALPATGEAGRG